MKRQDNENFSKMITILLLIGVVVTIMNAREEPTNIVEERTVDQYSNLFFTYTVIRYPASGEVLTPSKFEENLAIGFNTDTDELGFGRLEAGGNVKKYLNLSTTDGISSKITFKSRGTIEPLIKFDKNYFVLNGQESVGVKMDAGSYPGNYTGEVAVVVQRSKYDLLSSILGY